MVIAPPPLEDITAKPVCYLWAATGKQVRQTAPRPIAYMKVTWDVEGALTTLMEFDDPNIDAAFPLLIDKLTAMLNITPCPTWITDPDTGFETQVIAIGELMDYNYAGQVPTSGVQGVARRASVST